jgi:1,4-alpha-glucan branching enzyme
MVGQAHQRRRPGDGGSSAVPQDAIHLRAAQPALRGDNVHPYYVSDSDRVLAFHRWLEGAGQDVIVIGTLAESTWWDYQLGFPSGGFWGEVFNSDV